MKRVKHFTAVGNGVTMKLTMEVTTTKDTAWDRKSFIGLVDTYAHRALLGLAELGFPLTKVKLK